MNKNFWVSLLIMFLTIYTVRALPLTLLRKEIKSPFIRSFLYYVPYVSLSVMTFPAILTATSDVRSGLLGFAAAVVLAWVDGNLFKVSIGACLAVYAAELFLI
ncbi:MAG TPA: AzlD domain-containing protein [Candidatus Ventrimonas merdavium]|nr:AzlD domain-containing protein [Candidatus Ventrimonas merdavium]